MLSLTAEQRAALGQPYIMRRVFIYCRPKNPNTLLIEPVGFWDDVGTIEVAGKIYYGSGNVVQVSTITSRGDLTIPGMNITLNGIAAEATSLIRAEMIRQAPVTVQIGIFNTETRSVLLPLLPMFDGRIDDCDVNIPEASGQATITFTCESTSRALTIRRPDTRSGASVRAHYPTDKIYDYSDVQREKPLYFGRMAPTADT